MDSRPVILRTDDSADNFWSRIRESADVSPDFKVKTFADRVQMSTPYGRQAKPSHAKCSTAAFTPLPQLPQLRSSRSVERIEYRKAIDDAEKENVMKVLQRENTRLQEENTCLHANLKRALRINHALTKNMLF